VEAWLTKMEKPKGSKKDYIFDPKRYSEMVALVLKRKSSFLVPRDHTGVEIIRTQTTMTALPTTG